MIAQLIGVVAGSLCFMVIGAVLKKGTNWAIPYSHDFLIGFALANAVFTLVSLAFPINNTVVGVFLLSVTVLGLANAGYVKIYFRAIADQVSSHVGRFPAITGLLAVFVLLSFFQSLYSPSLHYDAGLYHVPGIKWTAEYGTVRGLVHLNPFLGYNFNSFSLQAAFHALFPQPIYPLNFILICLFSGWAVAKLTRAVEAGQYVPATAYLLTIYYLIVNFWPHVSTPSTDTLVLVVMVLILTAATDVNAAKDVPFSIIILTAYAITAKLSAAPAGLLAGYCLLTMSYRTRKKQVRLTLGISGFILIPWLLKNVLLTGWLLFPLPAVDLFPFDWKLPRHEVVQLKEAIRNYYVPAVGPANSPVRTWFLGQTGPDLGVIVVSAGAVGALLIRLWTKTVFLSPLYWAALGTSVFGTVFMFLNAPSLRYGAAFFLAALLLSVRALNVNAGVGKPGFYVVGLLICGLFLHDNWFHPWHFAKNIRYRYFLPYPLVLTGNGKFTSILLDNNVRCYYPVGSDQCFDYPLPCANQNVPGLHLRGNRLEEGFYTATRPPAPDHRP